ncbi:hypothetical protein F2Q68_00004279 [Brassica cretica]|uniref:Uncharacterized protein n=1 Tax=Brassica cretica TaxID=69181 RepID=A0A8S9J853_BRACR|nr:hypothetical protein F2Q68_00004279 [Brassica cretica]
MHGYAHICLPEHAEKFTRTMPVPDTYSRAEIDDMVHGIYRAHEMSLDDSYKRLDDFYYPINDSIDRLTARMDMLKEEIYMIRRQTAIQSEASIDTSHASLRRRMVTVKLLEDKLDEINFCQDRMKEDFSQRLEDISESTHARLGMQQHNISNFLKRTLQENTPHSDGHSDGRHVRRFLRTKFRRETDEQYILCSSVFRQKFPTKYRRN